MIRITIISFLTVASAATLALDLISYYKGVPDGALWVGSLTDVPHVQAVVVDGTLHVVYTVPLDHPRVAEYKAGAVGFSLKETTVGQTLARGVGVPCWFLFLLLGSYPAVALVRGPVRRRRRRVHGLCANCGYDLTGSESGICSECGTIIPTTPIPDIWWLAATRHLRITRPRRLALAVLTIIALATGALAAASFVVPIEHTTTELNLATLVDAGRLYLRYQPPDYSPIPGDVVPEDSVVDLGCVRFARAYERTTDGSTRATVPFVTDLELNLWVPFVLFALCPTVALIAKLMRRSRSPAHLSNA